MVPLLREHENLIVLRTFSKAMALLRCVSVIYWRRRIWCARSERRLPYNLNAFSQIAAEVAMENYERELGPLVKQIIAERDRVFEALSGMDGLTPVASEANFMVVKSATDPTRIFTDLLNAMF